MLIRRDNNWEKDKQPKIQALTPTTTKTSTLIRAGNYFFEAKYSKVALM